VLIYEMLTGMPPFYNEDYGLMSKKILSNDPIPFPDGMSDHACDLITKLLVCDPTKRLGYGKNGSNQIRRHSFFSPIDFTALYQRKIKPPQIRKISAASHRGSTSGRNASMVALEHKAAKEWDIPTPSPPAAKKRYTHVSFYNFQGFSYTYEPPIALYVNSKDLDSDDEYIYKNTSVVKVSYYYYYFLVYKKCFIYLFCFHVTSLSLLYMYFVFL